MKAKTVQNLLNNLICSYYEKRDLQGTLDCVSDDIIWIGTENNDSAIGKESLKKLLLNDIKLFPSSIEVVIDSQELQKISDDVIMVFICAHQKPTENIIGFSLRGMITCVKKEGYWFISNLHASVPNAEVEKQKLANELEKKRRIEQTLMAGIPGGIALFRLKKNGTCSTDYISESFAKMCDYKGRDFYEIIKDDALKIVLPSDIDLVKKTVLNALKEKKQFSIRYHILKKDQTPILVRMDANFIFNEKLQKDELAVLYVVQTVVSDESKQILSDQKKMSELIDKVPNGIGIFEYKDGKIFQNYLNNAFYKMINNSREVRNKYLNDNTINAVNPEDVHEVYKIIEQMLAGEDLVNCCFRLKLENNNWFWISFSASVIERKENYLKIFASLVDYNNVKYAEESLKSGRILMEKALNSAKILMWRFNYNTSTIIDTLTLGSTFKLPKTIENIPESILDFVHPESVQDFKNLFSDDMLTKSCSADIKTKNYFKNDFFWYKLIYTPVFDNNGNYIESIGIAIDITEQKQREQGYADKLRISKLSAVNALATVTYDISNNTVVGFEASNEQFRKVLQSGTANDVMKKIRDYVFDTEKIDKFLDLTNCETMRNAFEKGRTHFAIRHHLKNDSRWMETTIDILINPYSGNLEAFGLLHDITDIVQSELVVSQLLKVDYKSILIFNTKTRDILSFRKDKIDTFSEKLIDFGKLLISEPINVEDFSKNNIELVSPDKVIKENSYKTIVQKLEKSLYYETIVVIIQNGQKEFYRFVYSFLGKEKTALLIAVQNNTALYKQEEQQRFQLTNALSEAEKANRAKTDFMSRMSHDMRTPMNAIMGLSSLTIDDADKPEVVRENMAKMRKAGNFLVGLVNDILDMAKIEDGLVTLNYEPYSYSDFLMNMKTMFQPLCESKGIKIQFAETDKEIIGLTDKIRINQIFFNILSNAVKYTQSGGSISCNVENVAFDGKHISGDYVISDTGIGMSLEFQQNLYKPFMQEDQKVTPELQGSGLGLSITKQLVELMGGTINISSKKGQGTKVSVHLSFELVVNSKKINTVKKSKSDDLFKLAGKRILLAEDHPLNAQIARRLLEKKEMVVVHAENGKIALEKFAASKEFFFDTILMDVRMPEMSGFEATKAIRSLNRKDSKTVPIIAMSANAYSQDIKEGLDCGMNSYLTKPVEPLVMYKEILKFLN